MIRFSWKRFVFHISRPAILFSLLLMLLLVLGFYHARSLGRVEFYARYHTPIQFFKKLSNVFFLPTFLFSDKLPKYELTIQKDDLQFLNQNLPETYKGNLLTDEFKQTVKAKFYSYGKERDVEVRYRGDTDNHWRDPKKSWRIIFSQDNYFEGSEEINLILPLDRYYLMEELSFYRARKLGLVVPESKFVNLFVNGKRQGVYWQVEEWSKDILEKQGFSGDANLYGGRDFVTLISPKDDVFDNPHAWKKFAANPHYSMENYSDLEQLLDMVNNASDEDFFAGIGNILDLNSFYKWLLVAQLVSSNHQIGSNITGSNYRLFFDPTSGKFNFMPWDVSVGQAPPPNSELWYGKIAQRILENPQLLLARNQLFWEYVSSDENYQDDLRFYDELDELTKNDFYKDFRKVESNFRYRERIGEFKDQVIQNWDLLEENLKHANAIVTVFQETQNRVVRVNIATESFSGVNVVGIKIEPKVCSGSLRVYGDTNLNSVFDPLDDQLVSGVCEQGKFQTKLNWPVYATRTMSKDGSMIPGYNDANIFVVSSAGLKQIDEKTLDLSLQNLVTSKKVDELTTRFVSSDQIFDFKSATQPIPEFLRSNSSFSFDGAGLRLKKGIYYFDRTLIIPANTRLTIEPGTLILLGQGVSILSYSPVVAIGTPTNPVTVRGREGTWGAFGVVNASSESKFDYLVMSGGGEATVNGIYMTGMLSLFRSPGTISNSLFSNAAGDDGVNIKYGKVAVQNSRFEKNDYDGLDIDFSNSLISQNSFKGNGNDGIDVSGQAPLIFDNVISGSGDKCISVGEAAKAILFNNLLTNCRNAGIAIKDFSEPIIVNQTIADSEVGISSYQKKQIFGGGQGTVINSIIWRNKKSVELDGVSTIKIETSVVQGGYEGLHNVDLDPEFEAGFQTRKSELKDIVNGSIYQELGSEFPFLAQIGYNEL